jgi:hypothetical protein
MEDNLTSFDTNKHHIHIELVVTNPKGIIYSVAGILDTGAPRTEFSDDFLVHTGIIENQNEKISLKPGLFANSEIWQGNLTISCYMWASNRLF